MQLMGTAPGAELLQLEPARIVAPILLGGVVALTANRALHRHHRPISLRLLGHYTTSSGIWPNPARLTRPGGRGANRRPSSRSTYYSVMEVTAPAPTVRPPSRIANRSPSSIATGVISSTPIWMLSPGITISVPSGR